MRERALDLPSLSAVFNLFELSINLDGQSKDAASARAAQVSQGLSGWSLDVHIYIFTV